jgi:hypothetical protein
MNVYDYTNERLLLVKTSNPLLSKPHIMRRLGAALEGAKQGYARSAMNAGDALKAVAAAPPATFFGKQLPDRVRLHPKTNFLSFPGVALPAVTLGLLGARMSQAPYFGSVREFYTGSEDPLSSYFTGGEDPRSAYW